MATPELVLYEYPSCPYCQKVLRAIDDLKVKVELRDTMGDPRHRVALMKLMGSGQVPTLLIDGEPMRESDDIVDYLYETFGAGKTPPKRDWW